MLVIDWLLASLPLPLLLLLPGFRAERWPLQCSGNVELWLRLKKKKKKRKENGDISERSHCSENVAYR